MFPNFRSHVKVEIDFSIPVDIFGSFWSLGYAASEAKLSGFKMILSCYFWQLLIIRFLLSRSWGEEFSELNPYRICKAPIE